MHAFTFTCEHIIHVFECLNTSRSYWNVCVGRRHENGGELSEGFFLV